MLTSHILYAPNTTSTPLKLHSSFNFDQAMSTLAISSKGKFYNKPFHRRNDSDELDVFEASRYFSTANEILSYGGSNLAEKKIVREEKREARGGGISLDMPTIRSSITPQSHKKETNPKERKYKPPSSPGGKLASFLNSLFNQTSSKKKNSKSTSHSLKPKDESPGGRKRRSSISHFTFSSDSKSVYSTSSASGSRTPPPCTNSDTPVKAYKIWNGSRSDTCGQVIKPKSLQNEVTFIEEFKFITNGILEKPMKNNGFFEKNNGEKEIKKFDEVDDGMESDTSSDLFELTNYDLGYCSSGLPVYETTHMDNIKRVPPISSGAI